MITNKKPPRGIPVGNRLNTWDFLHVVGWGVITGSGVGTCTWGFLRVEGWGVITGHIVSACRNVSSALTDLKKFPSTITKMNNNLKKNIHQRKHHPARSLGTVPSFIPQTPWYPSTRQLGLKRNKILGTDPQIRFWTKLRWVVIRDWISQKLHLYFLLWRDGN